MPEILGRRLRGPKPRAQALLAEARANPNIECCGLLAGREGIISAVLPAKNALQSAMAYEIDPEELFALFRRMRGRDFGLHAALIQHENAVAHTEQLRQFRRDHHNPNTLARQLAHSSIDLGFGTNINTARGLVQ